MYHPLNNVKYLGYFGTADGTDLTPMFDFAAIQGRYLLVRGVQILYYAPGSTVQEYLATGDPGVTAEQYNTIPEDCSLFRPNESYSDGMTLDIQVNGLSLNIFAGANGMANRVNLENIYGVTTDPIQAQISVKCATKIFNSVVGAGSVAQPKVKIVLNCVVSDKPFI